jgi:hypothetical protein
MTMTNDDNDNNIDNNDGFLRLKNNNQLTMVCRVDAMGDDQLRLDAMGN